MERLLIPAALQRYTVHRQPRIEKRKERFELGDFLSRSWRNERLSFVHLEIVGHSNAGGKSKSTVLRLSSRSKQGPADYSWSGARLWRSN